MRRTRDLAVLRHTMLGLLLCGLAGLPVAAQPAKSSDKESKSAPAIKLPSGAIIVVTSDPDAIDKSASVYLTPERYKELNEQIELLKKQLAAEKPAAPSWCELDGRIEQRGEQKIVRLRATFKFRTTQARSVVFLGCQKMKPVEAKSEDGKLPLLASGDKGLSLLVEEEGEHTLRLELESALLPRGSTKGEVGFEIGLPGAAITLLSFATPAKVQRVTISRREISATPLLTAPLVEGPLEVKRVDAERVQPGRGGEALGPVTYLALSWEDESRMINSAVARSAEAEVQVTIGDGEIVTESRLRLKGTAKEWRLIAPSNAEVSVGRAPATGIGKAIDFPIDQAPDIVRPEPGQTIWRIRFRESNASELLAVVVARTPRTRAEPKGKSLWPVSAAPVLDVTQQSGSIRVKAPTHIKVAPLLKGDTQRLDKGDDPTAELLFRYRSLPMGSNNQPAAPLELDIRPASGVVQTRVQHRLQMGEGGWRLQAEVTVAPLRMEVESLDIEVPAAVVFEAATPKLVESVSLLRDSGPQRRVIQVKLAAAQRNEFTLVLEGFYPLPIGAQEMTLLMPRILNTFDRMGQVTVVTPDGFDLRGRAFQWESDKPGTQAHPLEPAAGMDKATVLAATTTRAVSHVDLVWKPHRADVRVESQIDVTFGDQQAQVVHVLKCYFADRLPKRLRVRASQSVTGLAVNPGSLEANGPFDWFVNLPSETGKETTVVFNYSFVLPGNVGTGPVLQTIPVLWPDGTNSCETRVRIWSHRRISSMLTPTAEGTAWEERPPEVLANESSLPLLVLQTSGTNVPLALRMTDPGVDRESVTGYPALTSIWIDRTLIQAQTSGAFQQYRARFHLSKWSARTFDVELPAGSIDVEMSFNGKRVDSRDVRLEGDASRTTRMALPAWRDRLQALVEIRYQLPSGRSEGASDLVAVWHPPSLSARVAIAAVRWQVAIPSNSVPLALGASTFEERWALRNGMAQPLAAHSTADLEKWIASGREPDGSETASGWEMADTGVTARQNRLAPLRVAVVPRPVFFAVVSLLVLAVGLLLSRLPKRAVGVLLSLIASGAVVVGVMWPQPSGQILAASQPGLALLALILGMQRFLQWRYRRRLARMPGFARLRAESALAHSNGKREARQTSTVDSPGAT